MICIELLIGWRVVICDYEIPYKLLQITRQVTLYRKQAEKTIYIKDKDYLIMVQDLFGEKAFIMPYCTSDDRINKSLKTTTTKAYKHK